MRSILVASRNFRDLESASGKESKTQKKTFDSHTVGKRAGIVLKCHLRVAAISVRKPLFWFVPTGVGAVAVAHTLVLSTVR